MYANFNLPEDLPTRYAVIYNSDIVDAVLNHIEGRQFGEIINAICFFHYFLPTFSLFGLLA